ncbi:DUF2339 domain-containing protein [Lysobacter pythonis]|uniref:DUF2339 domain-containing protein n=1 Tax=Solilutibacter pythonis TaxID=2483112 RepID=A0A3M2HRW3_9GAMM|nr:DUF2339 domain-containing protein [Lysobacter pythonis]RMH91005.1 DUF2339 domain-containing protein [Lysobacter pythonis]
MEGLILLAVLAVPILLVIALVSISGLKRRVEELEARVAALRREPASDMPDAPPSPSPPSPPPLYPMPGMRAPVSSAAALPPVEPPVGIAPAGMDAPAMPREDGKPATPSPPPVEAAVSAGHRGASPVVDAPPAPPPPNFVETAIERVRHWFTTGNVPVKVGMLVLLAGVAALLKYASVQGWLRLPIEYRLLGVSLAALAGLVFGWKQRAGKPAFALAVQGGSIGVLLLTLFAAAKMYALIPLGMAFGLSVVLIVGAGVLAVLQDSRTLAVLAVLAGFMAPIWLSDGGGSHVALFSYYALLNLAIFGVAWVKPWRVLMLLGFAFTWGIGVFWGVLAYKPHLYASTQPFLALFFVLYLAMPVLHARRCVPGRRDPVGGSLLFGTPLIAFALQAGLTPDQPMLLALIAVGVAAVYAASAWALRGRARYAVITDAHALLAVGLATLAVPLAFSARVTGAVLALEGAALIWFGLRQQRRLPLWSGVALEGLAAMAHLLARGRTLAVDMARQAAHAGNELAGRPVQEMPVEWPVMNGLAMSGLLVAAGGLASAWALWRARRPQSAALFYGWGLLWWLAVAIAEIVRFAPVVDQPDWLLMLIAVTGWWAAETWRRIGGAALALTTASGLAAALPLAVVQTAMHQQPFAGLGALAWAVYALLGSRSLVCLRSREGGVAPWAQFVWWLVWPAVASLLVAHWVARFELAQGWRVAGILVPWLAVLAMALRRPGWLAMPLGERFGRALPSLIHTYLAVVALGFAVGLLLPGSAAPLPWLPLLNPLELAQLSALALAGMWWSRRGPGNRQGRRRGLPVGLAMLVWVSSVTLRAVHVWGALPWGAEMFRYSLAQTSLTVLWSLLGVIGWIVGSRRGQRGLWLAGASLMGVVLVKLVLVDRQHLGNLLGIVSFIAYGLLCTVVGYFAPAPPRDGIEEQEAAP